MRPRFFACLALLLFGTGCFNETRTYSLSVRNDLSTPVSICLTKTHGSDERGWESPEDLAVPPHPASDQDAPGIVIQPGKTATRKNFTGRFDHDQGRAFLRVYAGTPSLDQMLAISAGSPNRVDVPLHQGANRIVIKASDDGGMTAVRVTDDLSASVPEQP